MGLKLRSYEVQEEKNCSQYWLIYLLNYKKKYFGASAYVSLFFVSNLYCKMYSNTCTNGNIHIKTKLIL